MWNLRNAIRSFSGRLKSGNCGPSSSREGRSELEDEYKHWTSNIWSNDCSKLPRTFLGGSDHFGRDNRLIFTSHRRRAREDGKESDRRNEWNASDVQSGWTTWLEALGWGAVLGLGLNVLLPKQEELLRRRIQSEDGVPCRYSPRWFTNVALSMPYGGQPSVIKSVLPTSGSSSLPETRRRDSVTWDLTSSSNTSYESGTDSEASSAEYSEHPKPVYTSESAALLSIMRQQLTTTARDYIAELQVFLSPPTSAVKEEQTAQEEFTLGLFHELGIGVKKDSDEAFKHYVEAAFLHHPGAIQNLVSLHQRSSSFGASDVTSAVHRSASSPVLSASPSHYGSSSELLVSEGLSHNLEKKQRKFWVSEQDSGESSSSSNTLSRSSSFPNLPLAVACI